MKYRVLGKTGLRVSVIGVGTWQFGGEWGRDYSPVEAAEVLDTARETGINLIDTAECYGDHLSEKLIGEYLSETGREGWILATKFGHHYHGFLDRTWHFEPEDVRRQLEESLRALKTDYIDLYQFHSGNDSQFETPGLWEELQRLVESGKVRHLGISVSQQGDPLYQIGKAPEVDAGAVQIVYNRLDREPEKEALPLCQDLNLGVLARVPLASGFLSGKYRAGAAFPKGDVRSDRDREETDRKLAEVEVIARDEVPEGVPMAAWALAWCLRRPEVTAVIPGCKDREQTRLNALAADLVDY